MTREEESAVAEMTDEQFRQHALEILQRTLGAGGFARFLRIYRPGSGDYTRDRHKWQQGINRAADCGRHQEAPRKKQRSILRSLGLSYERTTGFAILRDHSHLGPLAQPHNDARWEIIEPRPQTTRQISIYPHGLFVYLPGGLGSAGC